MRMNCQINSTYKDFKIFTYQDEEDGTWTSFLVDHPNVTLRGFDTAEDLILLMKDAVDTTIAWYNTFRK